MQDSPNEASLISPFLVLFRNANNRIVASGVKTAMLCRRQKGKRKRIIISATPKIYPEVQWPKFSSTLGKCDSFK